jgi:hypothetical protein
LIDCIPEIARQHLPKEREPRRGKSCQERGELIQEEVEHCQPHHNAPAPREQAAIRKQEREKKEQQDHIDRPDNISHHVEDGDARQRRAVLRIGCVKIGNACSYPSSTQEPANSIVRPLHGDQHPDSAETGESKGEGKCARDLYRAFPAQAEENGTREKQKDADYPGYPGQIAHDAGFELGTDACHLCEYLPIYGRPPDGSSLIIS